MTSADGPAAASARESVLKRPDGVDRDFTLRDLAALRAEVVTFATEAGATTAQVESLLIVTVELATNAVRHGGGGGRLQLWRDGDLVLCRVSDRGSGLADPTAGTLPPGPRAANGRGLWLCRQLSRHLDIRSASTGTTATAAVDLLGDPD
jgi:anti-sigma regulatory factor (Ser/Thr protein kinase)